METMAQVRQTANVNGMRVAAPMVKPGAARMQQVMKARAAKRAKDEAAEMRRRM